MCNFETWRDVVGFEGLYMVSNLGHVRRGRKPVNLKPGVAGGGTLIVALSKNGQRKNKQIKRLVWEAFNGPCDDKVIQLRDGNPNNCCLENLRAVSKDEHLKKTIEAAINKTRTPVDQYLGGVFVASYASMHEAERKTGIPQNHISEVCRGVLKTAGGYSWKYQEPKK